jgi:hypothetical protein
VIPKFKIISLALIALAATSVCAASAQAFQMHVTSSTSAVIIGQQATQFQLSIDAGVVKCNQATFEGTVEAQGGQQITNQHSTLTPTLAGCNLFGIAAQVSPNGCKFTLTGQVAQTAVVDITGCTSGKQIQTITATCSVTVPEQHGVGHVVFSNTNNAPHDVVANVTLTGVTYQTHGNCPNTASDHTSQTSNGATTGQATIVTRKDAGAQQVTLHGHQYGKLNQTGELVGILAT